jgi:hypothetical protein
MADLSAILNALDGVKKLPNGKYQARCPAHNDKSPSLAISETGDGKVLIKCWAGCEFEKIVSALGLQKKDFFPVSNLPKSEHKAHYPRFNAYEMFPLLSQESLIALMAIQQLGQGQPLNADDVQRVNQAINTILNLNSEFKGRKIANDFAFETDVTKINQRIAELDYAKSLTPGLPT